ncbi:PC-esterase domain-containing protein 1B [Parasteatoda tepidariorum]|uniref:PC-esterase domain-containing protein 1B n=1 Tax=Parasteatoda tepidariorum TaxID=114398 RepID=UPI00077FAF24|nr:uncharacterized protein LOC107446475 isoform X3 [Parasteatoda tepidariorum]XP_015916633.1 uncharacterized protein LOC107446475 isoform X3 [Parasteatoda tepidariorum]
MIDIFLQKDVKKLLKNKNIVFMGDSNVRALYKDTLCLLNQSRLISLKTLKAKGELSCFGDELVSGGPKYNFRKYREERKGYYVDTMLSFYFLTRVYDNYVYRIVKDLSKDPQKVPDVLIINSCLWDVTRWGPNGVELYKKNLIRLMKDLKERIPDCLVIWVTAPPIACDPTGGFLVKEIEFLKYSIRFHVVEANHYARNVVVDHGFDVVDSHYHLKLQIHRRTPDGIHWYPEAVRYVTNLLLTHISIAWNVSLPHRFKSEGSQENPVSISDEEETYKPKKVSSVTIMPDVCEKCTNDEQRQNNRKRAEIIFTPQKSKRSRRCRKRRSNKFQESHHSYLKRIESRERHNHIRQWKKLDENQHSNMKAVEAHCSPYSNPVDFGHHSNSNPEPYITHDLQRFIDSPRHIPLPPSPYPKPNKAVFNSPVHGFEAGMRISLQTNNMSSVRTVHISPLRSFPSESRQSLCWSDLRCDNKPFPKNNQLQFLPKIDFASTDDIPFGIQF